MGVATSLFFIRRRWQSCSFLVQRNRDKFSTRKFDVGVFTQPGPTTDIRHWIQNTVAEYAGLSDRRAALLRVHRFVGCSEKIAGSSAVVRIKRESDAR